MSERPQFGKYQPTRKIRSVNTYCTVFEAIQAGLERAVELRVMNCKAREDAAGCKRFVAECKTLGELDHPSIIRVHDVGVAHDHVYYVTDLREAASLHELLEQGQEFPPKEVIAIGKAIAGALHHLHQRRVIHRDISIHTIRVERGTGIPYIAEFSLAKNFKLPDLSAVGIPLMGALVRTPELAQGNQITERTDIYMLGMVLYRLLTFRSLRMGTAFEPCLHARALNPGVPEALDEVVARCLRPEPEKRFESAAALEQALDAAYERVVVQAALASWPVPRFEHRAVQRHRDGRVAS